MIELSNVVVLNASNEVIATVHWNRAVTLLVNGLADTQAEVEGKQVRSQTMSFPMPSVIRLRRYVHINYVEDMDRVPCNKVSILKRDKHTCAYCGGYGDTIDHVIPQAQGGMTVWWNVVTACFPCNNRKRDRTPQEAGMKLKYQPYEPRKRDVYY